MRCTAINLDSFGARHQNISRNIFLRPADLSNSCGPASLIKQQSVYCRIRMQYMRSHACTENNTGGVDLNPGRSIALPCPRRSCTLLHNTQSHTLTPKVYLLGIVLVTLPNSWLLTDAWGVVGAGGVGFVSAVCRLFILPPTPYAPPDHHLMSLLPKTDKTRDLLPQ